MVHYSIVFLLTALTRRIWEIRSNKKRVLLEWPVYLRRVTPTGINSKDVHGPVTIAL